MNILNCIYLISHILSLPFGHSHWFRKFFREFVKGNHVSKTQKVQNCGAIAFRMTCEVREDGTKSYEIKAGSITTIYRGFQ